VIRRERDQARSLLGRQGVAGRVLKVGDDVGEFRLQPLRKGTLERGDIETIRVEFDHPHICATLAQRQQRAIVGGPLDHDRVTGRHQHLEEEGVRLHRAVGDQHLLRGDAMTPGDPFAQRLVPDRGSIGGHARGVLRERGGRGGLEPLDVDDVQRGRTAGEGDRLGHG